MTDKINIDEVIADSESAQAIMYEQSKGIDHAALMATIDAANKEADADFKARGVDSWALFTAPVEPTPAEDEYMDACINAIDGPTGRRF